MALHEDSLQKHQFTPFRVNDSSISHLIHTSISFPTLISFIPLFFYFIHLYSTRYFASFRFLLLHFATFSFHFASFRLHFASFRFISYFSRTRFVRHSPAKLKNSPDTHQFSIFLLFNTEGTAGKFARQCQTGQK